MSWYRTGTVAVTNGSKTVTGVGTLFTTAINAGDAFSLVDANLNPTGAWYEIDAIVSNTELTLKQNYAGTTGGGKAYCIFNLVGNMTTPSFAQRLATFFASFQTLLDKPTSTPTALGIPIADENGNIADGWISAALLGLNGATVFKGTLGTNGTITALPTADYVRGWTYRIVTAGTYAGVDCALGDLIIALSSFDTEFKNSDWIPVHIADEMNLKADVTYVDAELALKANIADVDDALALKAPLASPALTGNPTAPTQTAGDNSNKVATTAYADAKVAESITEDVTGVAPSQAVVFDALALKAPLNSPTFTGDVIVPDQTAGNNSTKAANTKYADAKVADAINDGVTGIAPSQNAVFDALALKADASDVADALALKADADAVINVLESAVDENIPIFDGIAGDKLKDSGVKLSDKADLTYVEYLMMEGDPA